MTTWPSCPSALGHGRLRQARREAWGEPHTTGRGRRPVSSAASLYSSAFGRRTTTRPGYSQKTTCLKGRFRTAAVWISPTLATAALPGGDAQRSTRRNGNSCHISGAPHGTKQLINNVNVFSSPAPGGRLYSNRWAHSAYSPIRGRSPVLFTFTRCLAKSPPSLPLFPDRVNVTQAVPPQAPQHSVAWPKIMRN